MHDLKIRVYYEDTDAGGVVYHARYLGFAERGRMEMLRAAGYDLAARQKSGILDFAVVSINVNYRQAAKLDDLLTVKTQLTRVGGASMEMQQDIYREDQLITELKVTLVCVDGNFKAVRLPAEIRKIFD
jgi:acyl-CoA thioester hydrolase